MSFRSPQRECPASIAGRRGRGNRGGPRAPRCAIRYALALLAASLLPLAAVAEGGASAPRAARSLVGKERAISFSVTKGDRGIAMKAEYETAVAAPLEAIVRTLWDFEGSPKVFSRIESVTLLSDDGREALTEQKTAIRMLGLSYESVARFRSTLERPAPGEALCRFSEVGSDGSIVSSEGSWELRDATDGEGCLTYLRYSIETCVRPSVPGQELIMRSFGGADIARTLRELARAARKASRPDSG